MKKKQLQKAQQSSRIHSKKNLFTFFYNSGWAKLLKPLLTYQYVKMINIAIILEEPIDNYDAVFGLTLR